jgi:T-complex protein 11
MTFDSRRKPHRLVCLCGEPSPSSGTVLHQVGPDLFTARTPSRLPALLAEFLEVLLLVIQPLCSISGLYVNPNTFKTQMDEHAAQAVYIRSIFDPVLIEQELRHNSFDPSGLFRIIGETLKGHCAPMRDRSVEAMIRVAGHCGTSCRGTAARDSIKAFRMCMEILELMKLVRPYVSPFHSLPVINVSQDIANHQLQTLRPFLLRTSGQLELRTLKSRYGENHTLAATREWIQASHQAMLLDSSKSHLNLPGNTVDYRALSSNQQLYTSVLRGIVDLIFDSPAGSSSPSPATTSSRIPETLYLDSTRLLALSSDAVDSTALCMLLLLYRQLVFSDKSSSRPKLSDADLIKIKLEVRDIAAGYRLGRCLSRDLDQNGKEAERWRAVKEDVVLQVARRAEATRRGQVLASHPCPTSSSQSDPASRDAAVNEGVDERSLNVARNWADAHLKNGSPLSSMLHKRLRETVLSAVLQSAYPGRDLMSGCRPVVLNLSPGNSAGTTSGMEPLADEIRTLAEKISLLALIHLNAYLPMYESEGFAPSR